ncbi:retrotransposon ty1-copia subclass [Moniliophthora roreri MCA 2997]|uniref:Retrotransposon ty1-copia subclass n=1 Tax=Moniliophthora roreri (strain MCA 2997) TaxID=1381753 RepID=V2W4Q0_MONRO|nr:retrotransposon ty1-copia subclass [Moniliophthora roreri MCA 2997]
MVTHTLPNEPQYLHWAVAHIMPERLELGAKVLDGMPEIEPELRTRLPMCQDCREGNINKQPRPERPDMVMESNFWWFIDLWGLSRVVSVGGNLYGLFSIDEFTGRRFFEALTNRQAVTIIGKLEPLHVQLETQTGNKLKRIRSENAPKLHSDLTKSWFQRHGIIHKFTILYSSASNGAGEHTIGMETGRGKLDPQGEKVVMLGYNGHSVYFVKLWDSDKVVRIRDVIWLKDGGHWVETDSHNVQEDLSFLELDDDKFVDQDAIMLTTPCSKPTESTPQISELLEEVWGTKATRCTTRDPVPSRQALDAMNSELPPVLEPNNDWGLAIEKELKKMNDQKVFTPMPRPPNTPTVMLKWHYTLQKNGEGRIIERQARLVVRGFTQVKGVHYEDTWAMVARYESLWFIIAIAAYHSLSLWSGDFTAAYLNAKLQGVNYLNLSPEKTNGLGSTITVTYTDNVIGVSDTEEAKEASVKEIEDVYDFQFYSDICIYQQPLIEKIIGSYRLQDAMPRFTPLPSNLILIDSQPDPIPVANSDYMRDKDYRRLVGSLNHISQGT